MSSERLVGLPPIIPAAPRVLVLGSMPGRLSLETTTYYAHPRNIFWRVVSEVYGRTTPTGLEEQRVLLMDHGIALWDVVGSCLRATSLDSDIVRESVVPNPIGEFLEVHPDIRRICFNGHAAAELFRKVVEPGQRIPPELERVRLPSTSPANAGVGYSLKLAAWKAALT